MTSAMSIGKNRKALVRRKNLSKWNIRNRCAVSQGWT